MLFEFLFELPETKAMDLGFALDPLQSHHVLIDPVHCGFELLLFPSFWVHGVVHQGRGFPLGETDEFLGLSGEDVGPQDHLPKPLVVHVCH